MVHAATHSSDIIAISAAMALYAVIGYFAVGAMVAGARRAMQHPRFSKRGFIIGFGVLTLVLSCWYMHATGVFHNPIKITMTISKTTHK